MDFWTPNLLMSPEFPWALTLQSFQCVKYWK